VLYGGTAGGGKSDALLMAALQYVDVPGYSALLLTRSFAALSQSGAIMAKTGRRSEEYCERKAMLLSDNPPPRPCVLGAAYAHQHPIERCEKLGHSRLVFRPRREFGAPHRKADWPAASTSSVSMKTWIVDCRACDGKSPGESCCKYLVKSILDESGLEHDSDLRWSHPPAADSRG
jgi:hypothetical protein